MPVSISISVGSAKPIYRQIQECICQSILDGHALPGEPLPSVRALAEELLINPNTVVRAYAELSAEGLVASQPGRGYFLIEHRQTLALTERRRRLNEAAANFAREASFLKFSHKEILDAVEKALSKQN